MKEKMKKRDVRKAKKILTAFEKFSEVLLFPINELDFEGMYRRALDEGDNIHDMIKWYKESDEFLIDINDLEDICRFLASHRIACVWTVLLGKAHGKKKSD